MISELNSVNIGLMLKDLFNGFIVTYMLELYDFVMDEVDYNKSERDQSEALLAAENARIEDSHILGRFREFLETIGTAAIFFVGGRKNQYIEYETYEKMVDLQLYETPKYEKKYLYRHHGIGEIAISALKSADANINFVKNSALVSYDEMLCYIPCEERWNIVKEVNHKVWFKDDFFANELFNGLNPYTVQVVKSPKELKKEFLLIKDASNKLNLDKLAADQKLFISRYNEIHPFAFHTDKGARDAF